MLANFLEFVAGVVLFAALCTLVAAAALVSTALAVFVAGIFAALIAGALAYAAITLERRAAAEAPKPRSAAS
jgi:hypothetical protein